MIINKLRDRSPSVLYSIMFIGLMIDIVDPDSSLSISTNEDFLQSIGEIDKILVDLFSKSALRNLYRNLIRVYREENVMN